MAVRRLTLCGSVLAGVLVASAAVAVEPWDPARAPGPFTLDNGLTVAILPWEGLPLVEVRVFYPSSPVTEPEGKDGIAHLVEHVLFTSARDYPDGGLKRELELFACASNATTRPDYTRYEVTCAPADLQRILRLEAARMSGPQPTPQELERERSVVLEEIALRAHSSASSDLDREVSRAAFPDHVFGRQVGGTRETLESITEEDVRAYVENEHGPSGAVLVVAGDLDADDLRATVTELFGALPASGAGRVEVEEAGPGGGATVRMDRWDTEGFAARLGFRLPREAPHDGPLAVFTRELLRDSAPLASMTYLNGEYVVLCGGKYSYRTTNWAGDPQEPDAEETERSIHEWLWNHIEESISELDRAKFDRFLERSRLAYEDAFRDPEWVVHLTGLSILKNRSLITTPAEFDAIAAELTLDEVRQYLRRELRADRAVFGIAHGRDSGRSVLLPLPRRVGGAEDDGSRSVPGRSLAVADIREALDGYRDLQVRIRPGASDGGPPVHRVEVPGAAWTTVVAHQSFPPLEEEREGKRRGLAYGYDWLMRRSVSKRDSVAVSRPSIAVDLGVSERTVIARGRATEAEATARTVVEVLQGERTDVDEWRGIQRTLEGSLKSIGRSSWGRAGNFRWSALFGGDHPLVGPYAVDGDDAKKVLYKNVAELEKKLRRGEGLQLFLVGDPEAVDPEKGTEALRGLKAGKRRKATVPESRLHGVQGTVVANFLKPDVDLVLSFPPVPLGGEDEAGWAAAELAKEIAVFRLNDRLRYQLGLVYFVTLTEKPAGDAFVMELATAGRPDDMTRVFEEMCRSVSALASEGFTEAELERARLASVRRTSLWWRDPERVDSALRDMARHGDLPENPPGALLGVTAEEVSASLGSWLRPDRFAFSLVGPLQEEDIGRFAVPAAE